ncbi:MAG: DUF2249 domain-containing protein [Gammaproteobacteria bacterium]|nr:DUF2249 domain-containing protein [Gammaproteobacteria bacterium]
MSSKFHSTIDVRTIMPRDRHAMIFSTFASLPSGAALQLINDHDPQPLRQQFNSHYHGQFTWDYLEQGPAMWRVRIGKEAGNCCGSCGG